MVCWPQGRYRYLWRVSAGQFGTRKGQIWYTFGNSIVAGTEPVSVRANVCQIWTGCGTGHMKNATTVSCWPPAGHILAPRVRRHAGGAHQSCPTRPAPYGTWIAKHSYVFLLVYQQKALSVFKSKWYGHRPYYFS